MNDTKKNQTTKETSTVKKAMISQPMAGKTDEEIIATRNLAEAMGEDPRDIVRKKEER